MNDHDINLQAAHRVDTQPTENTKPKTGKVRIKPRQLSQILRQVIIDRFRACHSTEDIAEELRIPARTVTDVVLAEALRRPPQPERGNAMPVLVRRQA